MKKLIYGGLFLTLVSVGFVRCKKDQSLNKESKVFSSKVEISDEFIEFETIEDYERYVDSDNSTLLKNLITDINSYGFHSYLSKQDETPSSKKRVLQNEKDVFEMDELLGQLLNKDGVIKIGQRFFQVILNKNKVKVLKPATEKNYNEVLAELNNDSKNVLSFSTSDNVLDIIRNKEQEKCGGIGGGEYVSNVIEFNNNTLLRCQGAVKHFRAGIYFRTTARFEPFAQAGVFTTLFVVGTEGWAKKRPCNSGSIITTQSQAKVNGTTQQIWQFYSGIRNLNGLYLMCQLKCTFNGEVIYSDIFGRNVNSPY